MQMTSGVVKQPRFEVFRDVEQKHRWRLIAANGEIIAQSEGYSSKQMCEKGIAAVKHDAPAAKIIELR